MLRNHIESVVLIGAGNVAHHLGLHFVRSGVRVQQVFDRNPHKSAELAELLKTTGVSQYDAIRQDASLYVLAVSDDAIGEVAGYLAEAGLGQKLLVHTSGATSQNVLRQQGFIRCGVLYPLQTFSRHREPEWSDLPMMVDAAHTFDLQLLVDLAKKLTPHVYQVNDDQRATLHLAAVFVNNFTNHLFEIAQRLLHEEGYSIGVLMPLIFETVEKLNDAPPGKSQTGPALRRDTATISKHLSLLEQHPHLKTIYEAMTASIQDAHPLFKMS